jgi:hypothetical protein
MEIADRRYLVNGQLAEFHIALSFWRPKAHIGMPKLLEQGSKECLAGATDHSGERGGAG